MEQDFAVAYRVILDDGGFRKAVGLQTQLFAFTVVTLVKVDVGDTAVEGVRPSLAGIGLLHDVDYFKPACHFFREEEADDKISVKT